MSDDIEPVASPTEQRNPRTVDLDRMSTLEVLEAINAEDRTVPDAVRACLPRLAEVVDAATERLRAGGRVHYFGAGTSGRLAVLDAAELAPTYSLEPDRFVAHHAGGPDALVAAVEGVEDDAGTGAAEVGSVTAGDVVIGLTASGRTPYVHGALTAAARRGALTVLVSSNPAAPIAADVDCHLVVDTGAEVVAGSTRMKAGTAQKLVLNAFSTAVMVRLGKTYSNLMVDVSVSNDKLRGRVLAVLLEASGADVARCRAALAEADGDLKTALVMLLADTDAGIARSHLAASDGVVRTALQRLDATSSPPVPDPTPRS